MKKNITDFNFKDKRVIIRCDLNVPITDGVITDDTRIRESVESIEYLVNYKAKVIILSHLGRVKEETDKEKYSLLPVAKRLEELLNREVKFIPSTRGEEINNAVFSMQPKDIIMLENTRFEDLNGNLESNNDLELAKYWASLGEIFINDAFGTLHRSHASNVGIASFLPSGIGFLVKKEVDSITKALENPDKPLTVILGGAKVKDKIGVIKNAVNIADYVVIGGGMPYTFFKAMGYEVGASIVDDESIDFCKNIYEQYKEKIVLPDDVMVASSLSNDARINIVSKDRISQNDVGVDIGVATMSKYKNIISKSNTIIWNGPMGIFEMPKFSNGTREITECLNVSKSNIVIGGGDTIAALNKFGFNNKKAHISTGGGASLKMMEGKELPGLKVISNKE